MIRTGVALPARAMALSWSRWIWNGSPSLRNNKVVKQSYPQPKSRKSNSAQYKVVVLLRESASLISSRMMEISDYFLIIEAASDSHQETWGKAKRRKLSYETYQLSISYSTINQTINQSLVQSNQHLFNHIFIQLLSDPLSHPKIENLSVYFDDCLNSRHPILCYNCVLVRWGRPLPWRGPEFLAVDRAPTIEFPLNSETKQTRSTPTEQNVAVTQSAASACESLVWQKPNPDESYSIESAF